MLYEVLKTAKMGAGKAPDLYTALLAKNLRRDGEVKTLSGIPPLTFRSNGTPLLDLLISGNGEHSGTPTPDNPVMPQGTGDLETSGAKAGQYKIPISSANTTTPVYLGEVQTTRKIKKYEFTGQETWGKSQSTNTFYIQNTPGTSLTNRNLTMCSHFEYTGQTKGAYGTYYTPPTSVHQFNFAWNESATVEEWKSYLATQYAAGTPVTVWYVLANPETGTVNEPLMKIGSYADSISMEQAGVQIPTARGTNTLDVLTDVKPSEVYIKYKS